ncbi:MAG: dehydrogenase [Desulfamplus sp.]|nr:dehydrogenase [Desulfamplus sp.]
MKHITNISLGLSADDYQIETEFLGKQFTIKRFGTDGDIKKAEDLLLIWNKKADVISLGAINYLYAQGSKTIMNREIKKLLKVANALTTPVTTGETLRRVSHEWAIRHAHFELGNNFFTNARVLFCSGMSSQKIANVMSEYTDNLTFADPLFENSIPKILTSIEGLNRYANRIHRPLSFIPSKIIPLKDILSEQRQIKSINSFLLKRAVKNSTVIVIPYNDFYDYVGCFDEDDLKDKVVITTTAYDNRVELLREKGAAMIIDTTPKIVDRVVGVSVQEALMVSALDIPKTPNLKDDLLEVISEQHLEPRIIYPQDEKRRINRFAYLVHPLSQDDFKKIKPLEIMSEIAPQTLGVVAKLMAFAPPIVYSKVTGIKSPTGVEAEGWLLALGETPEEMQSKSSEFTTKKILQAAKKAKALGAQVMGISMLPKTLEGTSVDIAKYAALPVTTGNSYTASTALWACAEAVRLMGLVKLKNNKILQAKTMVIGATGAVGSICARLLATAFEEVYLVSKNMAKLLTIQEIIQKDNPDVVVNVSTMADTNIDKMDSIVVASSRVERPFDIMRVKPGCVITDITRPMIFSSKEAEKRSDVLIITGGEILLPGNNIEIKDIGLPQGSVYASLAETIILTLEGRFEDFTTGTKTEWNKVKEIYKLGLKHGMQLSSISGVNGVLTKEDISRVKEFALKKMKKDEDN